MSGSRWRTKSESERWNIRKTSAKTREKERKKSIKFVYYPPKKSKRKHQNDVHVANKQREKITGTNRNNIRKMAFSQATTTTAQFERATRKRENHYLVHQMSSIFRSKSPYKDDRICLAHVACAPFFRWNFIVLPSRCCMLNVKQQRSRFSVAIFTILFGKMRQIPPVCLMY